MLYLFVIFSGILTTTLSLYLAGHEMEARRSRYCALFHTRLVCCRGGEEIDLYRTHYVVGRRKRRCDLELDFLQDKSISKVHATLWYDGSRFCIAPVKKSPDEYTRVLVNGAPVPPCGVTLAWGDVIEMGSSQFILKNSKGRCDR